MRNTHRSNCFSSLTNANFFQGVTGSAGKAMTLWSGSFGFFEVEI
jgi:hypothetical protein